MKRTGGVSLLVLLLLALLLDRSRDAFSRERHPAFFREEPSEIFIHLGEGFPVPGIHQFSDGIAPMAVIELTMPEVGTPFCQGSAPELPLRSGELLELTGKDEIYNCFRRDWMSAGVRLALGIALHPDQMSRDDWEALPGIGPRLSERIEMDRQINGDFGVLESLQRVRGIGPKRIQQWREFFIAD